MQMMVMALTLGCGFLASLAFLARPAFGIALAAGLSFFCLNLGEFVGVRWEMLTLAGLLGVALSAAVMLTRPTA